MTTAIGTDLQQLKDLIITGNTATQKQITELATNTQKQIADLALEMKVGFAEVKGDIKELRAELKGLDAKFELG